jgi:hypothetical protein
VLCAEGYSLDRKPCDGANCDVHIRCTPARKQQCKGVGGKWHPIDSKEHCHCKAIHCPNPRKYDNATTEIREAHYPEYIGYKCNVGYRTDPTQENVLNQVFNITCQPDGDFSPHANCDPVPCPKKNLKIPLHVKLQNEMDPYKVEREKALFKTDKGYSLDGEVHNGEENTEYKLTCQPNQQFSPPPPIHPVKCGQFDYSKNENMKGLVTESKHYLQTFKVECALGFSHEGKGQVFSQTVRCEHDGSFKRFFGDDKPVGDIEPCVTTMCQIDEGDLTHVSLTKSAKEGNYAKSVPYNTEVTFHCDDGYEFPPPKDVYETDHVPITKKATCLYDATLSVPKDGRQCRNYNDCGFQKFSFGPGNTGKGQKPCGKDPAAGSCKEHDPPTSPFHYDESTRTFHNFHCECNPGYLPRAGPDALWIGSGENAVNVEDVKIKHGSQKGKTMLTPGRFEPQCVNKNDCMINSCHTIKLPTYMHKDPKYVPHNKTTIQDTKDGKTIPAGTCIDLLSKFKCDCDDGYENPAGEKGKAVCEPKSCGTPQQFEGTTHNGEQTQIVYFPQHVKYSCSRKYSTDGLARQGTHEEGNIGYDAVCEKTTTGALDYPKS